MKATGQPQMLTQKQRELLDREGYLVIESLFSDADLQPVIEELNQEVTRRAKELVAAGKLSQTFADYGFERQLAMISEETDSVARAIWNGTLASPAIFNLIRHPKLLNIAETLLGPEIIASSVYRLRPKIPKHQHGAVPWHQDSGYFEPYCDRAFILTVWLPLIDATLERGCLWVIPRVHQDKVLRHTRPAYTPYLEIPESDLPRMKPVAVPVAKGGVLLLSNRTPHASFENNSSVVRWSMDLRYQQASLPTNAKITRPEHETAALVQDGAPAACYPPEADFLVLSTLRPHEVIAEPADFHRLRSSHQAQPVTNRWS